MQLWQFARLCVVVVVVVIVVVLFAGVFWELLEVLMGVPGGSFVVSGVTFGIG